MALICALDESLFGEHPIPDLRAGLLKVIHLPLDMKRLGKPFGITVVLRYVIRIA